MTQEKLFTTFQRRLRQREYAAGICPASELVTPEDRLEQYRRLKLMIGNTPIRYRLGANGSSILIKDESENPDESHYGRVFLATLETLELKYRYIKPGDILYEVSSGSAANSFAWLCSRLGYEAHVYMPKVLPPARKQEIINFGASLEEVEGYVPEASDEEKYQFLRDTRRNGFKRQPIIDNEDFFLVLATRDDGKSMVLVNHSANPITPRSLEPIADEVARVLPDGVNIDFIVTIIGNGSNSKALRIGMDRYFETKLIGVEAEGNAVLFKQKYPEEFDRRGLTFQPQRIFGGIAPGVNLPFADADMFDEIRLVNAAKALRFKGGYNHRRPIIESIGNTSAMAMIVAEQLAEEKPGSVILTLIYDKGDRYGQPVVESFGNYRTSPIQERYRMSDRPFWVQTHYPTLDYLPMTLRQAYHPTAIDVNGRIVPLDRFLARIA